MRYLKGLACSAQALIDDLLAHLHQGITQHQPLTQLMIHGWRRWGKEGHLKYPDALLDDAGTWKDMPLPSKPAPFELLPPEQLKPNVFPAPTPVPNMTVPPFPAAQPQGPLVYQSDTTGINGGDVLEGAAVTGGVVVGGYVIYRVVRMLPSLFPPLWWTIPANAAMP
jgi:hypothetical protein